MNASIAISIVVILCLLVLVIGTWSFFGFPGMPKSDNDPGDRLKILVAAQRNKQARQSSTADQQEKQMAFLAASEGKNDTRTTTG